MKKTIALVAVITSSMSVFAENNFYAEFLVGTADQETKISGLGKASGDDTSIGIRGGYQFNEHVAVELAYQNYGEADDTSIDEFGDTINDKFETTAINLGVKGILPLNNGFSLIGRLGLSLWDYEVKETDSSAPGEVFKLDDDGTDFYYGIGAQYDFNENIFVGVEYTILDADLSLAGILSADHEVKNFSLSIGGKF